jgi:hypothetical protein
MSQTNQFDNPFETIYEVPLKDIKVSIDTVRLGELKESFALFISCNSIHAGFQVAQRF